MSPWAGWEAVLTGLLLLLLAVAVVAAVVLWSAAARAGAGGRAEWQDELAARSAARRHQGTGPEPDQSGDAGPGSRPDTGPSGTCRRAASHRASA